MNQQDANRIKELGLEALKNPNANFRKEALLELREYEAPIIIEVLEKIIAKDHDKEVRDLAQNLLTKRKLQTLSKSSSNAWTCSYCGSETSDPKRCPNCGAEHKITPQLIETKPVINDEIFVLHPSHQNFVFNGAKSLNHNSFFGVGCLMAFFSIFVIVGVVMLVGVLKETCEWYAINHSGVDSTAKLVDRRMTSDDDGYDYYVSFQYNHNGRDYKREQHVSSDVYDRAEVGGNVPIVYVPTSPYTAKIAGTNDLPTGMFLFVLFWDGIVFTILFFAIRQYLRMKFLERNGRMTPGQILKCNQSTDSDGDLSLKVEYSFYTPDTHQRMTKVERAQRNDLKGKPLPTRRTPVVVLYYDEQRYMLL